MYPDAQLYVEQRLREFPAIPQERQSQLRELALYIQSLVLSGAPVRLVFICTHNSRRSHLAQVWAAIAAAWTGVAGVETFSGGTEATAFEPRAVAALERAGLRIRQQAGGSNPRYEVRFEDTDHPLLCFSKVYNAAPNPDADFCAVMTCTHADENCPHVAGAALRVAIPFDDPKGSDGTPQESARYDERCRQISREMLYLFAQVGTVAGS